MRAGGRTGISDLYQLRLSHAVQSLFPQGEKYIESEPKPILMEIYYGSGQQPVEPSQD
jgi:hypothetical protein